MSERLGRYQLLHRIAFGGMAEIWLARHDGAQGFEKLVVLKRILPNLAASNDFLVMFFDEARLAAKLSHPNICQIYDLGSALGSYYIAMEYVHGENLRAVTRRSLERTEAGLPPPLAARIVSEACQGLHYAHSRTDLSGAPLDVVHRDVSPQNILVGYDGQVKIVDFGIAKAASQLHETEAGVIKGKYAYMSPEQCTGRPLDRRSDLFSLGVVLWEVLTGRRLFLRKNELKTMTAVCDEPAPPPSAVRAGIPGDLDRIVLKAMAKSPDARYQTGEEMHRDLEFFLRAQPDLVTASTIAARMESLFDDRLATWRKVFARSAGAPDEGTLGQHPELFEVGTPSQDLLQPTTPPGSETRSVPGPPAPRLEILPEEPSTTVFVDEILGEAARVEAPAEAHAPASASPHDLPTAPRVRDATSRRRSRGLRSAVVVGAVAVVATLAWAHLRSPGGVAAATGGPSDPAPGGRTVVVASRPVGDPDAPPVRQARRPPCARCHPPGGEAGPGPPTRCPPPAGKAHGHPPVDPGLRLP